jgi:hypothetical protein
VQLDPSERPPGWPLIGWCRVVGYGQVAVSDVTSNLTSP